MLQNFDLYVHHAKVLLENILSNAKVDAGHGIDHAVNVLNHATKALQYENLTAIQMVAVKLAALLHDADDKKFFTNSQNVQKILHDIFSFYLHDEVGKQQEILDADDIYSIKDLVKSMISLVSCSTNRNIIKEYTPKWMYIPRHADRLEAMGEIGFNRAVIYAEHCNRPLKCHDTLRVNNAYQLEDPMLYNRFLTYDKSNSTLDHYYDKILHLKVETYNKYLNDEMAIRHEYDINKVLYLNTF